MVHLLFEDCRSEFLLLAFIFNCSLPASHVEEAALQVLFFEFKLFLFYLSQSSSLLHSSLLLVQFFALSIGLVPILSLSLFILLSSLRHSFCFGNFPCEFLLPCLLSLGSLLLLLLLALS